MIKLGNWHDGIGTSRENSPHREAPNKHLKGSRKYKEMIDRGSKEAAKKNLPFSFSKPPKKSKPREDIFHVCDRCGYVSMVSRYRAGQGCYGCKQFTSVNSSNTFATEEEMNTELARQMEGGSVGTDGE